MVSKFQRKRSILRCDPPEQKNPHNEPGMEMLTSVGSIKDQCQGLAYRMIRRFRVLDGETVVSNEQEK